MGFQDRIKRGLDKLKDSTKRTAVAPSQSAQVQAATPSDAGHNNFPSSSTATDERYKMIPPSIIQKAHNIISEIETYEGIGNLSEVENKLVMFGLAALLQSDERNSLRQEYCNRSAPRPSVLVRAEVS